MLETVFQFKPEDERSSNPRDRAPFGHLALVGNALPRKCGLATFTTDVANALRQRYSTMIVDHYAMSIQNGKSGKYGSSRRPIARST